MNKPMTPEEAKACIRRVIIGVFETYLERIQSMFKKEEKTDEKTTISPNDDI